jgi:hypothetical protein
MARGEQIGLRTGGTTQLPCPVKRWKPAIT